ncbi:MAG: tRNA (adenosine(37)-N6)-threonylcarbamoyltransferase complex dimerization subunit type 1 TsaB [Eubacteriales bacterium]|nr:tRNA (adenosine(37)-N6)-threonylcarbamoyltransferase complex dimerization subunit type 1 TsaB [Eubacteriales bacterium]
MKILCVDTSGPTCSLAIADEQRLLYESFVLNKLTHSVNLMPMIEEAFEKSSLSVSDVDYFAAVTGPGSFTGVRIGVSAVKAMAHAKNKPCIAVNALDAYAYGFLSSDKIICSIRDARNKQVYTALYKDGQRLTDYKALTLKELFSLIESYNEDCIFVGDGTAPYREDIINNFKDKALIAPLQLNALRASYAAAIALKHTDEAVSPEELLPFYLRKPQAERELQKRG